MKKRLFVDMDGTLAVFNPVTRIETLYEKGYFLRLKPINSVLAAVKQIARERTNIEVNILSAYLPDSKYALLEKNMWLDKYLPEIKEANRTFLPCGMDKREFVKGGLCEHDYLLDDYTTNLLSWNPEQGIKLLNGINHTRGTWQGNRVTCAKPPQTLARDIAAIVESRAKILDPVPSIKNTKCERSDAR